MAYTNDCLQVVEPHNNAAVQVVQVGGHKRWQVVHTDPRIPARTIAKSIGLRIAMTMSSVFLLVVELLNGRGLCFTGADYVQLGAYHPQAQLLWKVILRRPVLLTSSYPAPRFLVQMAWREAYDCSSTMLRSIKPSKPTRCHNPDAWPHGFAISAQILQRA